MTKKHFIPVAKMISELQDRKQAEYWAEWFADFFANYNPRFDRQKFLTACGVDKKTKWCDFCAMEVEYTENALEDYCFVCGNEV
jgi:hypothetical protein